MALASRPSCAAGLLNNSPRCFARPAPLQVEQGLGIGTQAPLFNRMEAQATRFIKLTNPRGKSAPVTVVAHGKIGNTIGDLPAYDAFLLGGPYSGEPGRGGCRVLWLSCRAHDN